MPVYVTATIGATTQYLSTEFLDESSFWDAKVVKISNLNTSLTHDYGGYFKPSFGNIEFLPDAFEDNWPPPQKIDLVIETGESDTIKAEICNGTGTLKDYDQESVTYSVEGLEFSVTDDSKVFSGTLNDAFTWACGSSYLNLTLNTTDARSTSPAISWTNSSEQLVIDLMADIAAFYSHGFYIENGTLYLVDLLDYSDTLSLTEFDFLPAKYQGGEAVSLIKCGDYSVDGSDPAGKEITISTAYHPTQANIETALGDIKTLIEKKVITLEIAEVETEIGFNTQVTALDESLFETTTSTFNVHKKNLSYSDRMEKLVVEGRGAVT